MPTPQTNAENSPYSYYLDLLGQWPTGIALASQWLVLIDFTSVTPLLNNIQNTLSNLETESANGWRYNNAVTKYLIDGKLEYSYNNLMGCAFARQVNLPGEIIKASNQGLDYGGFQAPATSNGRTKYDKLSLTFLETNASFVDFILRPWAVAVGYYGLVARQPNTPKYVKATTLKVVMFAKTNKLGSKAALTSMTERKIYTFYNVAPVTIPSEEYSYMEEGLRVSQVEFVYDSYSVSDGNSISYINSP